MEMEEEILSCFLNCLTDSSPNSRDFQRHENLFSST